MPLSEHEQRLLDQIERALYAEDPKFASTVRSTDLRTHMRRRLRRAAVVFFIGFVTMLFGVASLPVGIAGFVIMLVALVLALSAWKRLGVTGEKPQKNVLRAVDGSATRQPRKRARSSGSSGSPMDRLEERWKKRWEERGGPS
jgi:Protein of unknown function (DUF3040)